MRQIRTGSELNRFAAHPRGEIRVEVARHPKATKAALAALTVEPGPVGLAAARHANCPPETIRVSAQRAVAEDDHSLILAVVENPNCPPDALEATLRHVFPGSGFVRAGDDENEKKRRAVMLGVAGNPNASADAIEWLHLHTPASPRVVLTHRNCPQPLLDVACMDIDTAIYASDNPGCSPASLAGVIDRWQDNRAGDNALRNPSCPWGYVKDALDDPRRQERAALNPQVTERRGTEPDAP